MSWNNLGKPVTSKRYIAAQHELEAINPALKSDPYLREQILGVFKGAIENDELGRVICDPSLHIELPTHIDLTGRFRVAATMMAAE